MDEDIEIINTNTRSEKIKNFFIDNKKILLSIIVVIILSLLIFFGYSEFKKNQKIKLSNLYNSIIIEYDDTKKIKSAENLIEIVNKKDPTYSLLSLYFIIDNNLISDKNQINTLFDILIKETSLDKEIKNLVIYKKGLFNADEINENELLSILNPFNKIRKYLEISCFIFTC